MMPLRNERSHPTPCPRDGKFSRTLAALACAVFLCPAGDALAKDALVYSIAPHTARQIHWRDGQIQSIEGADFLRLQLAPLGGVPSQRYAHMFRPRSGPESTVELHVRALSALDVDLARAHPFEFPFARVLVYWGCGEITGKDQPRVHAADPDQARLSRKLAPSPALPQREKRLSDLPEASRHHATNEAMLDHPSALEGEHTLVGPGTRHGFRIAAQRGFLPPIDITHASIAKTTGAHVEWSAVSGATAYFASTFLQHAGSRDVVIWTSSRIPETGWLLARGHPGEEGLKLLLARGVVLASDVTKCAMPSAVLRHAQRTLVYHLSAYGSESRIRTPGASLGASNSAEPIEVQVQSRATTTVMFTDIDTAGLKQTRLRP